MHTLSHTNTHIIWHRKRLIDDKAEYARLTGKTYGLRDWIRLKTQQVLPHERVRVCLGWGTPLQAHEHALTSRLLLSYTPLLHAPMCVCVCVCVRVLCVSARAGRFLLGADTHSLTHFPFLSLSLPLSAPALSRAVQCDKCVVHVGLVGAVHF